MTDSSDGPKSPFGDTDMMDKMMQSYLGLVRGMMETMPNGAQPPTGGAALDAKEKEIFDHLARAQMLWLNRGMGLWRQIGETVVAHGTEAMNAAPKDVTDASARDHRRMIALDKARACLREIGDLTRISAEEFQDELLEIEAALRASQAPDPYETPKRRARAKR